VIGLLSSHNIFASDIPGYQKPPSETQERAGKGRRQLPMILYAERDTAAAAAALGAAHCTPKPRLNRRLDPLETRQFSITL
jgi:hypothetical protein